MSDGADAEGSGDRNTSAERDGLATGSPRRVMRNGPERRFRTGWRVAGWLLAVVLAAGVAATLGEALLAFAPPGPPAAVAAIGTSVGIYAAVTAATIGYARRVDHRVPAGLGLGGDSFRPALGLGLVLGLAMTTAVFLVTATAGLVRVVGVYAVDPAANVVPGDAITGAVVGDLGPLAVIALLVPFFVAVGVAEEVLVRGYLLTNVAEGLAGVGPIDDRGAIAVAVLATGVLFGALHFANPHAGLRSAAMVTAVGVVLGWTYAATGDLGIPIGIHVTWNFSLGALFGFPVSGLTAPASVLAVEVTGSPLFTGGAFGPEAGLVMVLPLALAVAVTAAWARRTTGKLGLEGRLAQFDPAADAGGGDGSTPPK